MGRVPIFYDFTRRQSIKIKNAHANKKKLTFSSVAEPNPGLGMAMAIS